MEIILELFLTAFVALLFSFLTAKIVSLATWGGGDSASGVDADDAIIVEELEFADKFKDEGTGSEKKLDFVKERGNNRVDVFEPEQTGVDDQGFEREKKSGCIEESSEAAVDGFEVGEGEVVEGFESEKEVEFIQETTKKVDDLAGVVELKLDHIVVEKKIEEAGEEIEAGNETKVQSKESQMKEENEVKLEDDDWERIERSELEKVFSAATKFIEHKGDLGMENDVQMEIYGLYKIATEGPCPEPHPLASMVSSRSKWNAWQRQRLGNMNPEAAMEQYVTLVSDKVPDGERN